MHLSERDADDGYHQYQSCDEILQGYVQARYEDIRMLSIVRNCGMFMLYCICMVYAYQRLPYRLMPSWIHINYAKKSPLTHSTGLKCRCTGRSFWDKRTCPQCQGQMEGIGEKEFWT